jgi:hypothetical protein
MLLDERAAVRGLPERDFVTMFLTPTVFSA